MTNIRTIKLHRKTRKLHRKTRNLHRKTIKHKSRPILYKTKKTFVDKILYQWRKQTNCGNIKIDTTTQYIHDFYLSLGKEHSKHYHIHFILHHFIDDHNLKNNLGYVVKYYNKHSALSPLSVYENPIKIVKNMLKEMKVFKK